MQYHNGLSGKAGQPPSAKADGLSLPHQDGRDDRLVDESLARDVSSANKVGIRGKATLLAGEKGLRLTIGLRNEATFRASARCVSGVNQFDRNSSNLSLIGETLSQLKESPRLMSAPLAMSNRAIADTLQIFKGYLAMRVFCLRYKPFANYVVNRTSESGLPARQSFEMPFSRFSALILKRSLQCINTIPNLIHRFTRVELPIAVNGKVDNTKVNPQRADRVVRGGFRGINDDSEIEDAVAQDKVGLSHLSIEPGFLVRANSYRDNLSTLECQDRNLVQPLPRKNPLVIDHSRVGLKRVLNFPICLITLRDLGNRSNCHLRRELVVFSKIAVDHMVKVILPIGLRLECLLGGVIASLIESLHRFKKSLMLLWRGSKFNHQGLFHTSIVDYIVPHVKYLDKERGAFLCQLKQAVSCAYDYDIKYSDLLSLL